MTDVPLLAVWLIAFEWLLLAGDDPAPRWYWLAGVAIAAACLIKYSSLALIPAFAIVAGSMRHWRALAALVVPLLALSAWSVWNWLDYGGIHLLGRPTAFRLPVIGVHALEWLAALGVAAPFGATWWRQRNWGRLYLVPQSITVLAALAVFVSSREAVPDRPQAPLLWAAAVFTGLTLALHVAAGAWRQWRSTAAPIDRDRLVVLVVWTLGGAGAIIVLAPFMAMRHLLLALPAILLLLGCCGPTLPARKSLAACLLAVTATLGGALAVHRRQGHVQPRRLPPRHHDGGAGRDRTRDAALQDG